jgi:5,5'-dehydrodivanillate O-demethylase
MLTKEMNERLTRVGPGTPGGELFRRYWHPVATLSQMQDRDTKPVRILGEDLVLYRDLSGTFGLIDSFCPHRRMGMVYGIPEEKGLRCPYHGWLYDETGQCTEQPFEEMGDPEARFKAKVRTKAYPVQQMGGFLFTYMGPEPAPLLPQWDVFLVEGVMRDVGYANLPCNWLQCHENSIDPVHVEWLHVAWNNYIAEKLDRPELQMKRWKHIQLAYDRFEHGIVKRRLMEGGSKDDTQWKDGSPFIFPNMIRQGGVGSEPSSWALAGPSFQIRTPIDDTHTAHWWYTSYPMAAGEVAQTPEEIPIYYPPVPDLDENGLPRWELLDTNSAQDPAAWITQGAIADRSQEILGRSDQGIIEFRKLLDENIRIVEDGGDPMNTFRDPEENRFINMIAERTGKQQTLVTALNKTRQAAATKFSPVLNARGMQGGADPRERRQLHSRK